MPGFILGEKSIQSQTYDESRMRIPTTHIKTAPCYLIRISNPPDKNYLSVKLGFGKAKINNKPVSGELKKAGIKNPLRFFKWIRVKIKPENELKAGQEIKPDLFFKKGDFVQVSGTSKGKGFQGVVKRHAFAGGPRTHGQSDRERAPGSIGQTTTPGRVYKGKRMAGRMGNDRVTLKNLQVIEVEADGLVVKGLVPGARGGLLEIVSL